MTTDKAVIYKQVFDLGTPNAELVQTFEVPRTATLLSIDWDTRNRLGIALWYRFNASDSSDTGPNTTTWRVMVRGTGDFFMAEARFLGTVVRDGFAWHLLDADGDHIRWADA